MVTQSVARWAHWAPSLSSSCRLPKVSIKWHIRTVHPLLSMRGTWTLPFTLSCSQSGKHGSVIPGGPGVTGEVTKPQCCNFCGTSRKDLAFWKCSGCNLVRYCNKSCQKKHWYSHKVTLLAKNFGHKKFGQNIFGRFSKLFRTFPEKFRTKTKKQVFSYS